MLMSLLCTRACFGWQKTHLIPLPRSQTPPLARKRGRGRNIFLSCSVHSVASNHSNNFLTDNQLYLGSIVKISNATTGRKRGRGRNIFLSCSVHSAASNHSTTSSPSNQHCRPKHCPVQKRLQPSSEGHLGEKIDGSYFSPLPELRRWRWWSSDARAGGDLPVQSHNRHRVVGPTTDPSTRSRPRAILGLNKPYPRPPTRVPSQTTTTRAIKGDVAACLSVYQKTHAYGAFYVHGHALVGKNSFDSVVKISNATTGSETRSWKKYIPVLFRALGSIKSLKQLPHRQPTLSWLHCQDLQRHHWPETRSWKKYIPVLFRALGSIKSLNNFLTVKPTLPPEALPSTKKAPTVIRGTFRGKNRRFLFFPLCRSSAAGDGGAAAGGGGGASAHGRGGASRAIT